MPRYFVLFAFLLNSFGILPLAQANDFPLPAPGVMVPLSQPLEPSILKGIKVHPDNPFRFDFILDKGDGKLSNDELKKESSKLIKYFLTGLTIPEKDLWVNLSPYEKNRIIPGSFGLTEMGRDMLAEDYMLKQITASLIYPEGSIGKEFWKKVYAKAEKEYGTTDIPINTFNKVWIVPEKAVVYENAKAGTAYVVEAKLKVMLEEDYLSLREHEGITGAVAAQGHRTNQIGSQVIRRVVIPELEKEVNQDKNFAPLRQVYNSLILAAWYKKKVKDSLLEQVYANKGKIAGVQNSDPQEKAKIYQRYLKAFKKGVFNYIKEEIDPPTQQEMPRKYFSGGENFTDLAMGSAMTVIDRQTASPAMISLIIKGIRKSGLVLILSSLNIWNSQAQDLSPQFYGNSEITRKDQDMSWKKQWMNDEDARAFLKKFNSINKAYGLFDDFVRNVKNDDAKNFLSGLAEGTKSEAQFNNTIRNIMAFGMVREMLLPKKDWQDLYQNRIAHENRKSGKPFKEDKRPLAVVITDVDDWNGAMGDLDMIKDLIKQGYRVLATEADTFDKVIENVRDFTQFGPAVLILHAHGDPQSLGGWFFLPGSSYRAKGAVLFDNAKMDAWHKQLEGRVKEVILDSCSTGGACTNSNVADVVASVTGADTYAPMEDVTKVVIDKKSTNNPVRFYSLQGASDDFYGQKYGVIENTNDLKELAVPAYTVHPAGKPTQPADRAMISPQSKAVSVQEYNMLQKDSEYGNELVKAFSPNQQVYGINIWELYDQVRRGMGVYFAESTPVEALRELRKNFREALGRELVQRSDMTESIRDAVERISNAVFPLLVNEHNLSLRVGHLIKVTYLKPMPSGKPMQETVEGELSGFRFYKAMDDLDLNFRGQAKTLRLSIIEDTIKKHSPYIEDVVDYTSPAADDGRSQEPADQAMKVENKGISEAQLGKFWDDLQNEYVFYHATSANNLESIRKYGLDPSRKPYDVADIDKFNAYYQQVMGQEVPFPDRHKEETVYLTANVENAQVYAEAGPEVIQMMLSRIPVLLSSDLLDSAQKDELRAIQAKYGPYMDNHKSVILRIKGRAYFTDKKKFEEEFRHIEAHWGQEAPLTLAEYKKLLLLGLNNEKVGYVKPEDIEFPDQAMNASESKTGGIDLTEAHMNLQTQSAGAAIKFHIDPVLLEQLRNAPGFVPVLISISPMTDLKKFLGINVAV